MLSADKIQISVVMPTYNRAGMIQHAIRSVVDQTFKNWELIIIDDGSTDGTKRIVESFAHPRIIYKRIDHSGFVSKVRNEGNRMARADIIAVHDSDDLAFPDRLEEIYSCFESNQDADVVYHGMYMRFYDPFHDAFSRAIRPALPYSKEHLMNEQYIPGQIAYKRDIVLKFPYLESVKCCDDYQMLLQLSLEGCNFKPIFKNLYEYCDSPDSINVSGELDGSRKRDIKIILDWLKEKYNIDGHAMLQKTINSEQIISTEFIHNEQKMA